LNARVDGMSSSPSPYALPSVARSVALSERPASRTHWSLTVLRANAGLRALRPAGADRTPASAGGSGWRPLVAVSRAADDCHAGAAYEVKLGADGQNPNLRDVFLL
jgi:hypothetical protein